MKTRTKVFSVSMSICMLYQLCFPAVTFALTGGPSQPEVESFEPVGTSEMVDVFTGDFNYNIPLLDVDGYPVNIAYHSGVSMDQEASWVGLGWNLNPGVINRTMRGIPDEFSGDKISKLQYVKPNKTYGVNVGMGLELFGRNSEDKNLKKILGKIDIGLSINFGLGVTFNNYTGLGIESSVSPAISAGDKSKPGLLNKLGLNYRLNIASSSKDGLTIQPQLGINPTLLSGGSNSHSNSLSNNTSVSMAVNSRSGVKALSIQSSNTVQRTSQKLVSGKTSDGKAYTRTEGRNAKSGGISGGGTINYGTQTYTPTVSHAMDNSSFSFVTKFGLELLPLNPNFSLKGYYSGQEISELTAEREAYGNIYAHRFLNKDQAMLDFNREKEGAYSERNPVLAIPVYTHDLYNASGQGVAGCFKPYRNDVPNIHDPYMKNQSNGNSVGVEAAKGNLFKAGLNVTHNHSEVSAGSWKDGNKLGSRMKFIGDYISSEIFYEPSYFKSVGEMAEVDETNNVHFLDINGGALRPALAVKGIAGITGREAETREDVLVDRNGTEKSIATLSTRRHAEKRDKRNTLLSSRTVNEGPFCLNSSINYYEGADFSDFQSIARTTYNDLPDHHLTELSVTRSDGSRYVYGIPAYNKSQYEVAFTNAMDPDQDEPALNVNCSRGEVQYSMSNLLSPGKSAIESRSHKGLDHAYNVTKTPAYAHSYLLTDVLSADYVDINNNGPSPNDYGNYTHLTYYKVHSNYKWRVPYLSNQANYNEGLKSDKTDDNANVLYGEKEIWHVAKIEGKNHYALFYISEREDGFGVLGEHGQLNTSAPSYKLDKIELFAVNDPTVPIKTVHFEYDYSLCPNVDNNSGDVVNVNGVNINENKGKLTLKKLYFTYRKSTKGRFNAYTFQYNAERNPNYNLKGYDRWGNYKPNPMVTEIPLNCSAPSYTFPLSNADFPYVDQDQFTGLHSDAGKYKADVYAASWNLSEIHLPSGGTIAIEYESDDYAYVQDKRASQMVKLLGFCDFNSSMNTSTTALGSLTVTDALYDQRDANECMLFELPVEVDTEDPGTLTERFKESFNGYLYYNCLVNLTSSAKEDYNYEYIRGYTDIADAGVINLGSGRPIGWVKVNEKGNGQHPVSRSAWQYARMYLPHLVYPGSNLKKAASGNDVAQAIVRGIVGFIPEVIDMLEGINDKLRRKNYGKHVLTDKSWVRVENLRGRQFGGGSRVKRLLLHDNWQTQTGSGTNMTYGQEYKYTMQEQLGGTTRLISSGVASYEPTTGSDENPCKKPVAYNMDNIGVPNNEFYSEEPFGESFFPAPSVGYSRVEVRNYIPEAVAGQVGRHGTGKVVHQYYTAKDFPVITSRTDLEAKSFETSALFTVIGFKSDHNMTMSQGFQVEINDMHGKPKATLNYDEVNIDSYRDGDAFSGMKYTYATESGNTHRLDNHFTVIDKSNTIRENALVGIESEMVLDSRRQTSEAYSGSVALNLDWYNVPGTPAAVFSFFVWPDFSSEYTSFKSAVLTRVVNRFGILKSTEAFEEGSSIKTENVLLDAATGETLLTKTYNEYRDPLYNFTMPAHWVYDGMGQAYQNVGLKVAIQKVSAANALEFKPSNGHDAGEYFSDGDLVSFPGTSFENERYYVQEVRKPGETVSHWYLLDQNGVIFSLKNMFATAKIMRSGRKNMQGVPVMQVASLGNPVTGTEVDFSGKEVLNASAVSYHNKWRRNSDKYEIRLGLPARMKSMLDILSYLVRSNQLNNTVHNTLFTNGTPLLIDENAIPGDMTVINSELRAYFLANTVAASPNIYLIINSTPGGPGSALGGFGLGFVSEDYINADPSASAYNLYIAEQEIKDLLRYSDNDYTNNRLPYSFELLDVLARQETGAQFASVLLKYLDDASEEQAVTAEIRFEFPWPMTCSDDIGFTANPFQSATEGIWRKQKDWVFYEDRTQASNVNLRKDGSYTSFAPFYGNPDQETEWTPTGDTRWTCTNEVTKYSPNGEELENKDALGRYSAALYSNKFYQTPVAVAGNAKYGQIGLEDVEQYFASIACAQKALDFEGNSSNKTAEHSHTGKYSYILEAGTERVAEHERVDESGEPDNGLAENRMDYNSFNGLFNPDPGKYVVGAWVKVADLEAAPSYYENGGSAKLRVEVVNGLTSNTETYYPKGQIIEGWQRIEGVFVVAEATTSVKFKLVADDGETSYFDDIRVHPFDAKMKTYVYDEITQRLVAELDENNYATFYEYNGEGQLIRVKKETEKGVVTLKEVRSNQRKISTP